MDVTRAQITAPHRTEVAALLRRIDALQDLLVCHRIGRHPTEALWKRLDNTEKAEKGIRERHAE
jgi:hypothetical protein